MLIYIIKNKNNMKQQLFGKTIPSVVKDPFDAKYIETISMICSRGIFSGVYKFHGYIEFKNEKNRREAEVYCEQPRRIIHEDYGILQIIRKRIKR